MGRALTGRPLIGVTSSHRGGRAMSLLNRLALWRAGARSVRMTWRMPYPVERLDGLVIGGGDDISAHLFGGEIAADVRVDPRRDRLELEVLAAAAQRSLPVLGICRGAQMLNVFRGGSLHTDIYEVYERAPRMRTVLPRKRVRLDLRSRLARIVGQGECCVNALHHQSVDRVGDGLSVVARDMHGIVQAVEAREGRFCMGVQWHPEFLLLDRGQQRLFGELVRAAEGQSGA